MEIEWKRNNAPSEYIRWPITWSFDLAHAQRTSGICYAEEIKWQQSEAVGNDCSCWMVGICIEKKCFSRPTRWKRNASVTRNASRYLPEKRFKQWVNYPFHSTWQTLYLPAERLRALSTARQQRGNGNAIRFIQLTHFFPLEIGSTSCIKLWAVVSVRLNALFQQQQHNHSQT